MLQATKLLLLTALFAVIGGNQLMAHLIGPSFGHTVSRTNTKEATVMSTTSPTPKITVVSTTTEAPNAYNHPKFYFGPQKLSWFRAYDYCKERKWQLVILDSEQIRLEFESYLTKYKLRDNRIWTAGNQLTDMKTWRWGLDGPKITYTHWGRKQPDNYKHKQHCLKLFKTSLEWDDDSCERAYNFACLKN